MRTLLLLSVASAALAQAPDSAVGHSAAGMFSDSQATRGSAAYQAYCESCHELGYHTSDKFRGKWIGRSVYELFTTLRTTMPDDNPGGLTSDEYVALVAYILKLNGLQPGGDSLAADSASMSRLRFAPP